MQKLETERKLYQMINSMLITASEEIPESNFSQLPEGGGNSPNWILGHLTLVNLMGSSLLGKKNRLVVRLLPLYGPGSNPASIDETAFGKDELISHLRESISELIESVEAATVEQLDAPQQSTFLEEELPTVREMLAHILTTHLGIHFGQLSAWRRGRGYDSILKFS